MLRLVPLLLTALSFIVSGCISKPDYGDVPGGAAVYYWKTVFKLDSTDRRFIASNGVKRIYLRMFDVVVNGFGPTPNATVTLNDRLPRGVEYVPVVFIVNDVMRDTAALSYAPRILQRVKDMAETNSWPAPQELQIDCDWTQQTSERFHQFISVLHELANEQGMRLSVTIRLHQLAFRPPDADYGVLMVYNTGDIRAPQKGNPILSANNVDPYLKYLSGYRLPLIAAYPAFKWPVLYLYAPGRKMGKYEYRAILYGCDPDADKDLFHKIKDNEWIAIASRGVTSSAGTYDNIVSVTPGMRLIMFTPPPFSELLKIKRSLAERNSLINKSVIIFDLNSYNNTLYSSDEYKEIFNP